MSEPFSTKNNQLTPTLKLKRRIIVKNYYHELENMYINKLNYKIFKIQIMKCSLCKNELDFVFSLGKQPLANKYPKDKNEIKMKIYLI